MTGDDARPATTDPRAAVDASGPTVGRTDPTGRTDPSGPAALDVPEHLRLAFEVFVGNHQVSWLRFAHLNTGGREAAEAIVDEAVLQLGQGWPHALAQDSVESYAMNILKTVIVQWLARRARPVGFVDTAAFLRAVANGTRRQFDLLEESLGLYSAIAALPERQHMVVVLRYVLGYSDRRVALLMGIDATTVRTHAHHAKQRLAADLHLGITSDAKD